MRERNAGKTCKVDGCNRDAETKGRCKNHYREYYANTTNRVCHVCGRIAKVMVNPPLCWAHYNRKIKTGSVGMKEVRGWGQ
jgi:hypothetical protein